MDSKAQARGWRLERVRRNVEPKRKKRRERRESEAVEAQDKLPEKKSVESELTAR